MIWLISLFRQVVVNADIGALQTMQKWGSPSRYRSEP
ncbi:Uncharacterised protein [Vibrio cholerae]|nr:Uncharacterised protein [Vibrio cholerae]